MSSAAQDEADALFNPQREYSRPHPEDAVQSSDRSDSASDNDISIHSDFGDADTLTSNTATMPSATYHIPQGTIYDANTGPKGVIADAQSFDQARKRSFRSTLRALSNGHSAAALPARKNSSRSREKSSSPELSADDEEDEFMRTWRASRMNELRTGEHDTRTRRVSPSKRKYGSLETVDAVGYLDAVEKVPVDTVVVVCIYDHAVCQVRANHSRAGLIIVLHSPSQRSVALSRTRWGISLASTSLHVSSSCITLTLRWTRS